jgi:hypothetical protein
MLHRKTINVDSHLKTITIDVHTGEPTHQNSRIDAIMRMFIEKGVPLPDPNKPKYPALNQRILELFEQMDVGDSFLVPSKVVVHMESFRSKIAGIATAYHRSHMGTKMFRISTRKQPDGLRIWRVK